MHVMLTTRCLENHNKCYYNRYRTWSFRQAI